MKRCEQFRELILIDYSDGQLDALQAKQVEEHLMDCAECRTTFNLLRKATVSLRQTPQQQVPAELWSSIKGAIEQENAKTNPLEELAARLKGLIAFPRLVPVLGSIAVMFIVGSLTFKQIQVQQLKAKEQGEYLASVVSTIGSLAKVEKDDLDTPIERYFL